jgi:mannose-1-phosphate guanylyltransferase
MLQETVLRATSLVPLEHVFVVTTAPLVAAVRRQLPGIPRRNIIGEPTGRNTAACIGLAALRIEREDPGGVMVVLPADHLVTGAVAFRQAVRLAIDLACEEHLVTIGIPPTAAETAYGYIEWGTVIGRTKARAAWAASFTEKPTRQRAGRFLASGRYLWNSGIFAWRARTILREIDTHIPALGRQLARLRPAVRSRRERTALARSYRAMPSISIDYGVLERAERVAVVRGRFGWSDVGSWAAMEGLWRAADGNAVQGTAVAVDARGCVVSAPGRLVALCGVDDLVVVDAPDAVLICHKQRAQDVRLIVQELGRRGLDHLL